MKLFINSYTSLTSLGKLQVQINVNSYIQAALTLGKPEMKIQILMIP